MGKENDWKGLRVTRVSHTQPKSQTALDQRSYILLIQPMRRSSQNKTAERLLDERLQPLMGLKSDVEGVIVVSGTVLRFVNPSIDVFTSNSLLSVIQTDLDYLPMSSHKT